MSIGQQTQIQSYLQVQPTVLSRRQEVLQYIQNNPSSSRRQVAEGLGLLLNSVTARVKELLDEGVIKETGKTVYHLTGKTVAILEKA